MADGTKIEWSDATVNAVNGCSVVSPGCTNCYAMRLAGTRMRTHPSREGLTIASKAGPVWNGKVRLNERALLEPLHWRRPRKLFWNAHGDLFHPAVPDEWIDRCFAVMALTPQHSHQILTKRPARMREYLSGNETARRVWDAACEMRNTLWALAQHGALWGGEAPWPLFNVWLGTSVEDQTRADERIPHLVETPAAVRFLSCEPVLGLLDIAKWLGWIPADTLLGELGKEGQRGIDWVICGGESGPGARPMHPDWARSVRDQCAAAGAAFHFKQWGAWAACQANDGEWPTNTAHCCRLSIDGDRTDGGWPMQRVGKKHAGRLLDGVEHNGMPA